MKPALCKWMMLFLVGANALDPIKGLAVEASAEINLDNITTSNTFMDASREWDVLVRPAIQLGMDFGDYWSSGYNGEVNLYTQHQELFSNWHEFYLFANPAWGDKAQNEYTCEFRTQMLFNSDSYETINLIHPALLNKFILEPQSWFKWQMSADVSYRWFYLDRTSDSIDAWLASQVSFSLPSGTTLVPYVRFGLRYSPHPKVSTGASGAVDKADQQLEAGFRVSQSLWRGARLHADFAYQKTFGPSVQLQQKLTLEQFVYLGEEFLFGGYYGRASFLQMLGNEWAIETSLIYEKRQYEGWPAMDEAGALIGRDREDSRLVAHGTIRYTWSSNQDRKKRGIGNIGLALDYAYLSQNSNSNWYQTAAHVMSFSSWIQF